jgi:signal transduction histidine kinase/ligand-binding sensor domain-containing protein
VTLKPHQGSIEPVAQTPQFQYVLIALHRSRSAVIGTRCLIILMTLLLPTLALGSIRTSGDYIRADFTVEEGLPDNVVNAIIQTGNGLLWVGTESGLASFDGREFTPIDLRIPGSPAQGSVDTLVEASNGDLWVGTHAGVVLIPRKALDQFDPSQLTYYRLGPGASDEVEVLFQTRDGALWAGTNHGLYRQESGGFVPVIPALSVNRIAEALDGHLLLITQRGFIEWDGHRIIEHPGLAASFGVHDDQIFNVYQDQSGTMWYCTNTGIVRRGRHPFASFHSDIAPRTAAFRTYAAPDGNIWVATGRGLYRAAGDRLEAPAPEIHARSFYAGRDGELWAGTNGNGLIRLKRRAVRMYTSADGLLDDLAMAALSGRDGRLWVGSNCGLSVFEGNRFKSYREKDGLFNSCVWALAEDRNRDLWIGTYGGGLFRFRNGRFNQYSLEQGLVGKIVLQIGVAQDDSLWIATPDGISHMQNGHFRNYTIADGLSSNQVFDVYQDRSGRIWAATQGGIDHLVGETFVPLPRAPQTYNPLSIQFAEDSLGDLYTMDSPKGISLIENDRLITVNEDIKALGMVESPQHDLWFSGIDGIIRIARDDLKKSVKDRDAPLDYARFDRADGLNSVQCSVGAPNMAITPDEKLWVATVKGMVMIDLAHLPQKSPKPKVFVGAVTIGRLKELARGQLKLLPGTHHVELHMEAIDLASPEKVRLQYRMDGVDAGWLDADASRTAIYTDIPVGTHAFHVRASGSNGVWDRIGIIYNVTQQPYYYQTTWFLFVSISAFVLLLSALYLIRVRQIVRQTRIRLEERLVERERIARELHDTLLQGFLSASMQLDVVEDQLPDDAPTKPLVGRVLQTMRQVTKEGRSALNGLRSQETDSDNLALAFARVRHELSADETIAYRVIARSAPRRLRPQIRDEVYRIGREAIVNSFLHGKANSVEVDVEFGNKYLRILVRDDGCGIDPHVLDSGREGHWGLPGMRERSEGIGATLKLRSRIGAGTEVELIVPGAIAFEGQPRGPISQCVAWLSREKFEIVSNGQKKREHK